VTSGTTGKIALASATVADNNENLKWALSKTGTLNFTLETAATLTGSNAVTANLTVNAALIVNEGTLTVTTGTLVPEGTGTLTTGTGGKVLLNKTQNNPNFAWALTNAGNPLALDVGADTNAIGTVKQGTVVTVVDSFKLTVPTATAFTVEGDLKLPGTGTLDVIGTIAGAGTVSTDGSGTVDLSNTAAVTTNGLNLKWALDAGATKLDLKQPATAAANTAIGKVTLDLTAALTVPQGGTLAIATAEGKVSATLGGSEKLVAAGAETGGTVTLLADGETLHAGLTTGAGVAGTALKAAVDALVADAAKLVDTVTLDSVAFAGVEGTAVGTTTVTTNNTGVAVWTATDGTQNSGAAVKLADDTTFADDGGAATGATGDISNAETFLASLDSGALKLKDTGWVTSNAKKVLVEFTGLKIENAGVALPLGTFHIGLLTQRG
jgi:hypothetical protein